MIKGEKAYQHCSLTLKQCHMAANIWPSTTVEEFLPRNIMAIVLSENICLFPQLKLQKAHKVERGASPLL